MAGTRANIEPLYRTIVMPEWPELQHVLALLLIRTFGDEVMPGVSQTNTIIWDTQGAGIDWNATAQDLERQGFLLLVGRRGARFHSESNPSAIPGRDSLLTLVAHELGIEQELWYEKIAALVLKESSRPSGDPLNFAYLLETRLNQFPDKTLETINWAMEGLAALIKEQIGRWQSCRVEFVRKAASGRARVETLAHSWTGNSNLKITAVESADEEMLRYLYRPEGMGADIAMVMHPFRRVEILAAQKGVPLIRVARFIRAAEMRLKGVVVPDDMAKLESPGRVSGAEEWNFRDRRKLSCGSAKLPELYRTRIPFDRLFELIKLGLTS